MAQGGAFPQSQTGPALPQAKEGTRFHLLVLSMFVSFLCPSTSSTVRLFMLGYVLPVTSHSCHRIIFGLLGIKDVTCLLDPSL